MSAIALKPGQVLDEKYEIVKSLHSGKGRSIYLCKEIRRGDLRAIKMIWGGEVPEEAKNLTLHQFEQEVKILRTLHNQGIPRFFETFSYKDWHYLVMEYVEGKTLREFLKERGQPAGIQEAIKWAIQICGTLHYLHNRQHPIIFRDLHPSNIMLSAGDEIKLIDFGVARVFDDIKTKDTYVMGTFGFAAPEQYGEKQTNPRTDIYALGATLYYALTLESVSQFFFEFPPVRKYNKGIPHWLEAIISQCLEKDPAKRPQDAHSLRGRFENGYEELQKSEKKK